MKGGEIVPRSKRLEVVTKAFEGAGGDEPFLIQLDLAVVVAFQLGELGGRLCRFESKLAAIQRGEQLPGGDPIAFLNEQALDLSLNLGNDLGIGLRFERGGARIRRQKLFTGRERDLDRNGGVGSLRSPRASGRRQSSRNRC